MTMVEQVARAMYGEAALINAREMEEDYPRAALEGVGIKPWESLTDEQREWYQAIARAAIEAMREPTEEMIRAGYDWQCTDWPADWSDDGRTPELYTAQHMFPAMIAAALGEP